MDAFISSLIISLLKLLIFLPYKFRLRLFTRLFKIFYKFNRKSRIVSKKNLEIAFPELTDEQRAQIMKDSYVENARLLADYLEIPKKDKKWFKDNIDGSALDSAFDKLNGKNCILLSGHLGSFEYLLHYIGLFKTPVSYIARNFKQQKLDNWWNAIRQSCGHVLIPRKGATRLVLQNLRQGNTVGFLFDQNLTREKSVFVPWFNLPAATTKTLGLAVIETELPVIIVGNIYKDGKYVIQAEHVEFSDILKSGKTYDEKCYDITYKSSQVFEKFIREFPQGWFWMHSRWRTRPNPEEANVYGD